MDNLTSGGIMSDHQPETEVHPVDPALRQKWVELVEEITRRVNEESLPLRHSVLVEGIFFLNQGYLVISPTGRFGFARTPDLESVNWDAGFTNVQLAELAVSLQAALEDTPE